MSNRNAAKTEHDAYLVTVDLASTAPALKVVSQSKEPNAAGTKICVLNRPVDLATGTADGITGALENAVNAALRAPTSGNDSSESVNVAISPDGYTVTLNPIWEKAANLKDEPAIAVTYAGIVLKPRATPDLGERLDLASACELQVGLAE